MRALHLSFIAACSFFAGPCWGLPVAGDVVAEGGLSSLSRRNEPGGELYQGIQRALFGYQAADESGRLLQSQDAANECLKTGASKLLGEVIVRGCCMRTNVTC